MCFKSKKKKKLKEKKKTTKEAEINNQIKSSKHQ